MEHERNGEMWVFGTPWGQGMAQMKTKLPVSNSFFFKKILLGGSTSEREIAEKLLTI